MVLREFTQVVPPALSQSCEQVRILRFAATAIPIDLPSAPVCKNTSDNIWIMEIRAREKDDDSYQPKKNNNNRVVCSLFLCLSGNSCFKCGTFDPKQHYSSRQASTPTFVFLVLLEKICRQIECRAAHPGVRPH